MLPPPFFFFFDFQIGKPHVYTSAEYQDVFTAAGLIPTAPTPNALVEAVNGACLPSLFLRVRVNDA